MEYTITVDANKAWAIGAARLAHIPEFLRQNLAIPSTDAEFLAWAVGQMVDGWAQRATPPQVIAGVPQSVTRRQAIRALKLTSDSLGVPLYGKVQPAIDAIADAAQREYMQDEWNESQMFERTRPSLVSLARDGLGLSDPEIDDLFRLADAQ